MNVKNKTGDHRLDRLAANPCVEEIWIEMDGCFGPHEISFWLELAPGYNWEGCSCIHEASIRELFDAFEEISEGDPS
jgi:hypothetical protein